MFHWRAGPSSTVYYQSRSENCMFTSYAEKFRLLFFVCFLLPNHAIGDSPSIENWLLKGFPYPRELSVDIQIIFSLFYIVKLETSLLLLK